MIFFLNFLAISCLGLIVYQDYKSREVYWFLFPLLGLLLSVLFFKMTTMPIVLISILLNTILISLVIILLYLYTKVVSKTTFLNHSFGLGDVLFFYAFSLGFPSITFIILFTFSILFSTLLYFSFKRKMTIESVPLAGYMSLFLIFVLSYSLFYNSPILYIH